MFVIVNYFLKTNMAMAVAVETIAMTTTLVKVPVIFQNNGNNSSDVGEATKVLRDDNSGSGEGARCVGGSNDGSVIWLSK